MDKEIAYTSLALLATTFIIYKIIIKHPTPKNKKLPPSPLSIPIIGHLHLLKPPFHRSFQSLAERYGPIFYLKLGSQRILVVSSPWATEECFAKNDVVLANRPRFIIGQHLGYNYTIPIWCPYGEYWRNLRRVSTITMLSLRRINEAGPTRKAEIRNMILEMLQSSKDGKKVNLSAMFYKMARNFVMRLVNGEPWKNTNISAPSTFITICDFFPMLRWVGFKGIEKGIVNMHKERDEYLQSLVDEYRKSRAMNEKKGENMMTSLIGQLLVLQDAEPENYPDELLKGLISNMLFAGSDTTARTIEWAMSNLLNHPEILDKAKKEIDTQVGTGRLVSVEDLPKLSYILCIIYETLRLFPPAPLLVPHCASKDCTIGGYHVPEGTVIFVNAWALHRDPKYWDEPLVYKPERFEKEKEGYKFMPFGIGRRYCPGNNVALRNVFLTLATLIQCFDWEATGGDLVDLIEKGTHGLVVPKEKPLEALCHPRSSMEDILSQI